MRPTQAISKFKIYQENTSVHNWWANYADENVLLVTHPRVKPVTDLTDPVIKYVSTLAPSLTDKRTALMDFLMGSGRTKDIDTDWVSWKLMGGGEITATSGENLMSGVTYPGINNTLIKLKLNIQQYVEGDVICPDIAKDNQLIVEGIPEDDGTWFIYTCRVVDRGGETYFPAELFAKGLSWIKIDAVYGEASRGYGSTSYQGASYLEFASSLTDYGKQVEVTNKAHQLNLRMEFYTSNDTKLEQYPAQIISQIEAEFLAEAKWEKEKRLFYGRSSGNQLIDPSSGYHRRIGPGLMEFLEDGNHIPYPVTGGSLDMFEDFLQSIWFDRVDPSRRNVVAYTGQGGLKLWRDWLAEKDLLNHYFKNFDQATRSATSYDQKNYSGYKINTSQPTEASFFPFGSFRVEHWPILDNTTLNGGILHPETGLPLSSYQFIILDYGMGDGVSSNIELLKRRDSEVYTYQCGTWSPVGPLNSGSGRGGFTCSGPNRSYILYHADTLGLRVKDVSLTAWFDPYVVA
jgi:hypothetical protein